MIKKITRYCCPVCGKDNWDMLSCPRHGALWLLYAMQKKPEGKRQVWEDIQIHGPLNPNLDGEKYETRLR